MRTDPRPKGGTRPADIPAPRPAGSPAPANAVSPAGGTAYANAAPPAGSPVPANTPRPAGSPGPRPADIPAPQSADTPRPAGSTTYANAVSPAGGTAPANTPRPAGCPAPRPAGSPAPHPANTPSPANAAPPPPVSPIRQVLWDWNGTLLDDLTYAIGVRNRTFPAFGLPRIGSVAEYHRQFTFPVRRYYERAGVTDETFVAVAHAWMAEYVRGFDAVPLHGDAVETLARFAAAGVRQAVLSATRRDMLESQIARFPIRAYFTDVLGLSDIYARSKEAVGLDYLARCGVPAASTLMIGDTLHDAEVARAMGTGCVLVARGHQSRETLLTAGVPVMDTLLEAAAWAGC